MHRITRPRSGWTKSAICICLTSGYNKLREQIFANQKKLGVIPQDTQLEPWPTDLLKNWDDLTPERTETVYQAGGNLCRLCRL